MSREVIADSIETVMGCELLDGLVAIGGCDKNMPGCMMAIARLNRPAVFVYGGTIKPGAKRRDIVAVFEAVGGFPPLRFMEDVFISQSLRRRGRLVVAPRRVFVSDRRWRRVGVVRQSLHNWTLTALAMAGVHPDRLARFYPVVR